MEVQTEANAVVKLKFQVKVTFLEKAKNERKVKVLK